MSVRPPIVSILLCTCNRAEHLRQTLIAMRDLEIPDSLPTELLIVDNASRDETPRVVQEVDIPGLTVRYLYEGTPGQATARNTGMDAAKGDIFLWTDDDVRPSHKWIEKMCEPLLSGKADGVAGEVRMADYLERPWMEELHCNSLADTRYAGQETTLTGANMGFVRKVRDRVPLFDPELGPGALGFMDDYLYSYQLREAGFTIERVKDAVMSHHFDVSRLQRRAWLRYTELAGRSIAYVRYHWNQEPIPKPRLRRLYWSLSLRLLLASQRPPLEETSEGCPTRELRLRINLAQLDAYEKLVGTPQKYDRKGLRKKS